MGYDRRVKNTLRNVGLVLTSTLAAFVILELGLRVFGEERKDLDRTLKKDHVLQYSPALWSLKYRSHPFFGYVCDKSYVENCNNHGFISEHDFPYEKKEGEYVLGVFGGSVADGWFHYSLLSNLQGSPVPKTD